MGLILVDQARWSVHPKGAGAIPFESKSLQSIWHDAIRWNGIDHAPDLSNESRSIAFCLHGTTDDPNDLYVMINADRETKSSEFPNDRRKNGGK